MLIEQLRSDQDRRKPVYSAEIAQLKTQGYVPIVATSHYSSIQLYNWRPDRKVWKSTEITHYPHQYGYYYQGNVQSEWLVFDSIEESYLEKLSRTGWCHRLGLAAGDERVFLVYKRMFEGTDKPKLYVDIYEQDSTLRSLERITVFPLAVPFDYDLVNRSGYYLWSDYDQDRNELVILTQTYPQDNSTPALSLLTIDGRRDPGEFLERDSWNFAQIGTGGYDLDAVIRNGKIHCIFREEEYPVRVDFFSNSEVLDSISVHNVEYAPLNFVTVRVAGCEILDSESNLSGGEHPQIQTTDPLGYTVDRYLTGSIVRSPSTEPIYQVETSQKYLYLKISNTWTETQLMEYSESYYPRNPEIRREVSTVDMWTILDPIVYRPPDAEHIFQLARPHNPVALFAPSISVTTDGFELDLVHHNLSLQALVKTHIVHNPVSLTHTNPDLSDFAVLDINHEHIPNTHYWQVNPDGALARLSRNPRTEAENEQFRPFSYPDQTAGNKIIRTEVTTGNSTGGDLAAFRWAGIPISFVFIHPGDCGGRVINNFIPASVQHCLNQHNLLNPSSVTGSGTGTWQTVEQTVSWLSNQVPLVDHFYYYMDFISTGLDREILSLFVYSAAGLIGNLSDDEQELTITNADIDSQPDYENVWDSIWDLWDTLNAELANISGVVTNIGNLTVEFSRFIIQWEVMDDGTRSRVHIKALQNNTSRYRFQGRDFGQGRVQGSIPLTLRLPDPRLSQWMENVNLASASVVVSLDYWRLYTPAILTSDIRGEHLTGSDAEETLDKPNQFLASTITMKPLGSSRLDVINVMVNFHWNVDGHLLIVFIPALLILLTDLGLGWLATRVEGTLASVVAAANSLVGMIVAGGLYAALVAILETIVPDEIRKAIRNGILEHDLKSTLDNSGLMTNAGEGIAEDIAYRILEPDEREYPGLNRIKQGVWKMIFVAEGQCKVLSETSTE